MANFLLVSNLKTVSCFQPRFSHSELVSTGHLLAKKTRHMAGWKKSFLLPNLLETYDRLTLSVCTSRISTPSLMVIRCHAAEQYCRNILKVLLRGTQEKFCDKIKI